MVDNRGGRSSWTRIWLSSGDSNSAINPSCLSSICVDKGDNVFECGNLCVSVCERHDSVGE